MALTKVVVWLAPLKLAVELGTKFVPLMAKVCAAAPAGDEAGERLVMEGDEAGERLVIFVDEQPVAWVSTTRMGRIRHILRGFTRRSSEPRIDASASQAGTKIVLRASPLLYFPRIILVWQQNGPIVDSQVITTSQTKLPELGVLVFFPIFPAQS